MENAIRFRDMLRRGEIPLGTIVSFNDAAITEALCRDLDFIWTPEKFSANRPGRINGVASRGAAALIFRLLLRVSVYAPLRPDFRAAFEPHDVVAVGGKCVFDG